MARALRAGNARRGSEHALDTRRIARVFYKGAEAASDSYSGSSTMPTAGRRAWTNLRAAGVARSSYWAWRPIIASPTRPATALATGYAVTIIVDGCRGIDVQPGDSAATLEDVPPRRTLARKRPNPPSGSGRRVRMGRGRWPDPG